MRQARRRGGSSFRFCFGGGLSKACLGFGFRLRRFGFSLCLRRLGFDFRFRRLGIGSRFRRLGFGFRPGGGFSFGFRLRRGFCLGLRLGGGFRFRLGSEVVRGSGPRLAQAGPLRLDRVVEARRWRLRGGRRRALAVVVFFLHAVPLSHDLSHEVASSFLWRRCLGRRLGRLPQPPALRLDLRHEVHAAGRPRGRRRRRWRRRGRFLLQGLSGLDLRQKVAPSRDGRPRGRCRRRWRRRAAAAAAAVEQGRIDAVGSHFLLDGSSREMHFQHTLVFGQSRIAGRCWRGRGRWRRRAGN